MRSTFQTVGTLGAVFLAGVGGNMVASENPVQARNGWWMLVAGAVVCTGGLASIGYYFVRDWRARLMAVIRGARLFVEEERPGFFHWRLLVELILTPPNGHEILFNSDRIKARIGGLAEFPHPLEYSHMGISPSTNPRLFDGAYAELTITRPMGIVCEGVTDLTMPPGVLTFPQELKYDLELTDASGDWSVVVESTLYGVRDREWAGCPDRDKPDPEPVETEIAKWVPFGIVATGFVVLVAWMAWRILVRHWL